MEENGIDIIFYKKNVKSIREKWLCAKPEKPIKIVDLTRLDKQFPF